MPADYELPSGGFVRPASDKGWMAWRYLTFRTRDEAVAALKRMEDD